MLQLVLDYWAVHIDQMCVKLNFPPVSQMPYVTVTNNGRTVRVMKTGSVDVVAVEVEAVVVSALIQLVFQCTLDF